MTIIIPAYKPDEKLIELLKHLKEKSPARLLVVNDGSGKEYDAVFREAERLGAHLLVHKENQGKGAALKTAFRFLLEEGFEGTVCTADADGQHLPEDILRCIKRAQERPDTLILGSRVLGEEVPLRSRFGNAASRITFRLLMGVSVRDTQTGLRAFSSRFLSEMLTVEENRYEYEMKILCNMAKKKIPMEEIVIETVYLDDNASSHFHPVRDALRVYGLLLRCALGRLFQFVLFLLSSLGAFLVDVVVYDLLFYLLLKGFFQEERRLEFFSLLIARILSSVVNYLINRKVVFQNLKKPVLTFTAYTLVAIATFFAHEWLNALFLIRLSFSPTASLLLAQTLFFPVSFLAQKYLVFPKGKKEKV